MKWDDVFIVLAVFVVFDLSIWAVWIILKFAIRLHDGKLWP
jgi:hypothetical protein